MNLVKSIGRMGLVACAVALFAGCGKSVSLAQGRRAPDWMVHEPMAAEGTSVAVMGNFRVAADAPAFRRATGLLLKWMERSRKDGAPAGRDERKALARKQVQDLWDAAGVQWALITVGSLAKPEGRHYPVPDVAAALALKRDPALVAAFAKAIGALVAKLNVRNKGSAVLKMEPLDIAGVRGGRIAKLDAGARVRGAELEGIEVCWAWVDDALFVCALSPKALANQIALYRDGRGKSSEIVFDQTTAVSVQATPVGKLVSDFSEPEQLKNLPDGLGALIQKFTDLRLDGAFSSDYKTLVVTASLRASDAKVVDQLREQLNVFHTIMKMGFVGKKKQVGLSETDKQMMTMVEGVRIGGRDDVTLSIPLSAFFLDGLLDHAEKQAARADGGK